ncbi:MAG: hypothetical protein V5A46_10935 [Haloferacaceae archaeon]
MVVSTESAIDLAEIDPAELFEREYENAVVYADLEAETILHEGKLRILASGWVELPTGRLLSPEAVHHVDVHPSE